MRNNGKLKKQNRGKTSKQRTILYLKSTSKPSYMSRKIFDNNLIAIRKSKLALKLNKPAYIGMCILEMSKVLMQKFYHDYFKNKYDRKSELLFTDTDGLMYEIKTEDVYQDFGSNKEKCSILVIIRLSQNTMIIQT